MGRPKGWGAAQTGRPELRSPGRPGLGREFERRFWIEVAKGLSTDEAAVACGVSPAVGARWFRQAGGMPLISLAPLSGRYLSFAEREEIALLRAQGVGVREIARRLERSPSTISRELKRNAATRCGQLTYRASTAQWKAELAAKRTAPPQPKRIDPPHTCRNCVHGRYNPASEYLYECTAALAMRCRPFGQAAHYQPRNAG